MDKMMKQQIENGIKDWLIEKEKVSELTKQCKGIKDTIKDRKRDSNRSSSSAKSVGGVKKQKVAQDDSNENLFENCIRRDLEWE